MPDKPSTALRVSDLEASLRFYVDGLGFGLTARDGDAGVAQIDLGGYAVLLAGPRAGDPAPHLAEPHEIVPPHGHLPAYGGDLEARQAALRARGIACRLSERPWGDRTLLVPSPDGHTVAFWTIVERTPAETMALYALGPGRLDEVLAGLPEADLDLAREPGEWTIRQIVHHLADSEATVLASAKFAIAEPGRTYLRNGYNQDVWAGALRYAARPIAPSVALFRAIRGHMLDVLEHVPGAWDRATVDPQRGPGTPVGVLISMLASHALEHIEDIRAIRAARGRG